MRLYNQDNREALKELPDNSVDSIVTDPPYGLSFMNKKWDYDVPSIDFWREVYRVLKPGSHVLAFGGTRTYHRMVVNIEDAGFEIRDQIQWIYASGFPKSLNIGKAVDKIEGNEREVVNKVKRHDFKDPQYIKQGSMMKTDNSLMLDLPITKGSSEYEGWGSALKPANEPIVLARKPLSEKSISENVMKWRTGGLNIDGCRIGFQGDKPNDTGRFPANVILECICDEVIHGEKGEVKTGDRDIFLNSNNVFGIKNDGKTKRIENYNDKGDIHTNPDCPCYIMDEQSGTRKSCKRTSKYNKETEHTNTYTPPKSDYRDDNIYSDMGGASRFFYRAKVSKKERNLGLDGFEDKKLCQGGYNSDWSSDKENDIGLNKIKIYKNNHPTVKPINLLTYLCRLITPPNGVVLDPFMGSGSTGVAALLEGFDFIGMELEKDYYEIAKKRIENHQLYKNIIK